MPVPANSHKSRFPMVAKTLFGLEETLSKELIALGAQKIKQLTRSVEFYGGQELLYKANLWCRTATRILVPIKTFQVREAADLYRKARKIDWGRFLNANQTIAINAVIINSVFDNSLFVAQKTKDAIADQFRDNMGKRPSVDLKSPDIRINVYINQSECTLSLDSSNEPLFKRGYRGETGKAPLNEVLAAGIVLLSGWDGESSFVDGMCGSGTILIEAGLMARNIAPGLNRRKFGFMNWPDYDKNRFSQICTEAREQIRPKLNFEMLGSDIDSRQVKLAASNARRAGLEKDIRFTRSPLIDLIPPIAPGVLIVNPPYGERLAVENINDSYHLMGDAFKKNFTDYDAFVFTGNLSAAKHIGLRTSQRIEMYNGPIECRLLKFEMYRGTRKVKHPLEDLN
ncbi:MAG: THUMP domain-containing protein [bacterium]|nr:THUMP domain-containing protein [bacterium]